MKQIKYLHTDKVMKFRFIGFNTLYKSKENVMHLRIHHTPQQNIVVERIKKTLMKKACCMLSNSHLPKSFGLKQPL